MRSLREHPNHRERGPKRFHFTYADLAEAMGTPVDVVRSHAKRKRFNPSDLKSVLWFMLAELAKANLATTTDHVTKVRPVGEPTPNQVAVVSHSKGTEPPEARRTRAKAMLAAARAAVK